MTASVCAMGNRVAEALAPARLGDGFRWLIGSQWLSNLGDGVALAAGPLLIEAETGDVTLVGTAWMLARLPWVLFALHAGVIADRLDRRRVIGLANSARAVVLCVFAVTIGTGQVNVPIIFAALFVLGVAEVFADITSSTMLPMLVAKSELTLGNSRLMFGQFTLNQLVGPPVGAFLFTVGMWIPFAGQAATAALAAAVVQRIVFSSATDAVGGTSTRSPRQEIADGVRWLFGHPPVRTLALAIFFFNITFGGSFSVLVVLSIERLGLSETGFGLLVSMSAVGGVVGTALYRRTEARIGVVSIMRIGLLVEAATHLVLATTTTPIVAFVVMFLFGVHVSMWGTTSSSIRQGSVPLEFQGRVSSVYNIGLQAGLVVGAAIGAVLAGAVGVTGPYWFGFVGTVFVLALLWRPLDHIARTADLAPEPVA